MVGDTSGRTTYKHPREGFSVEIPSDWEGRLYPGPLAFAARDPNADGFSPNVNVTLAPVAQAIDGYLDSELARAAGYLTDLDVAERERVTLNGRVAVRILARYRQGRFSVALEQWIVATDSTYFTISGAAEESDWGDVSETIRAIAQSLDLGSE